MLAWRRFALRCRDLFLEGEDTSWYEVGDENGAVALEWDGPVRPEPVAGALFAAGRPLGRLRRSGSCRPQRELARAVVRAYGGRPVPLGPGTPAARRPREVGRSCRRRSARSGDRFVRWLSTVAEHREGRAAEVEVPLVAGWSVLRMTARRPSGG